MSVSDDEARIATILRSGDTWAARAALDASRGTLFDDDCSRDEMARGIFKAIQAAAGKCAEIAADIDCEGDCRGNLFIAERIRELFGL